MQRSLSGSTLSLITTIALTACGGVDDTENPTSGSIELLGDYASNFGGGETITENKWGTATIVEFDNMANYAITQQPTDDMFNPSKFSKIVWTEPDKGTFFYCTVEFGKDTAVEARETSNTADPSDPASAGCSGFSWTRLGPTLEIAGTYKSSFGGTDGINSDMWGTAFVREYDNDANVVYLQLPADDMFNPDKFNKVVFTEPVDGAFYYCWVEFGVDTLDDAKASSATWNDSKPDESGCGGFAWTKLTPE